ncbi:MAG: cyclopropane-fatty-acyl-phospholipid synthase family protein [Planctomycetota bacterium]
MHRLLDRGVLPDWLVRAGIRRELRVRLRQSVSPHTEERQRRLMAWVEELRASPIAVATDAANDQHYALPPEFFVRWLGPNLKYSSALWRDGVVDLAAAEAAMLDLYLERAEIADGMTVLDLGCGWGSLSLWIARRRPRCRVLAVSNSASQRVFLEARIHEMGVTNVRVVTADANDFDPGEQFDRVVSVEMLEHVRNYERMFERIARWLRPGGKLFVHIFTHRDAAYPFTVEDEGDWMARFFFTGGQMPADALLLYFQQHLRVETHWRVNGSHYRKTADAWLAGFDRERTSVLAILRQRFGDEAQLWYQRWRVFLMACSELWGYRKGEEWLVSHYRLVRALDTGSSAGS